MPDDKGILTDKKLQQAIPFLTGTCWKDGCRDCSKVIRKLERQATLDALRKVTDEELVENIKMILEGIASCLSHGEFVDYDKAAERIVTILSARHQKELEEAVKQAKKEVWDEAAQSTAEAIDAQVKMERERIKNLLREGYLEKHWPNCDAQLSHWEEIWKVLRGEWPGGK